jgi:hypothetical protein
MEVLDIKNKNCRINFSLDELLIIANSFNEVCNGLRIMDFQGRLGMPTDEAQRILTCIGSLYDVINDQNRNDDEENGCCDRTLGVLEITDVDLQAIANAIDEVFRWIEPWEYQTRIGVNTEDAVKLNDSIKTVISQMKHADFTETE